MAEVEQNMWGWGRSRSMVWASVAGVAVSGPLLGMMGFSLLATVTLLLISSPLLLIFSPLLVCVGLVFGFALAGFGIAVAMALAGVSTLAWMYREVIRFRGSASTSTSNSTSDWLDCGFGFGETERVKEKEHWAGYSHSSY